MSGFRDKPQKYLKTCLSPLDLPDWQSFKCKGLKREPRKQLKDIPTIPIQGHPTPGVILKPRSRRTSDTSKRILVVAKWASDGVHKHSDWDPMCIDR